MLSCVTLVLVAFTLKPSFLSIQLLTEYMTLVAAALLYSTVITSSAYLTKFK